MTDQTKCPHCGAEKSPEWKQLRFHCGTIVCDGEAFRSSHCELVTLRAKVAEQQELLREAATSLRDALAFIESSESRKELWLCCHDNESVQKVLNKLEEVK